MELRSDRVWNSSLFWLRSATQPIFRLPLISGTPLHVDRDAGLHGWTDALGLGKFMGSQGMSHMRHSRPAFVGVMSLAQVREACEEVVYGKGCRLRDAG